MTITEVIQELELAARKNSLPEYHINQTWICECGAKHTRYTLTPEWRWTGTVWEHYHGYPIGHVQTHPEK